MWAWSVLSRNRSSSFFISPTTRTQRATSWLPFFFLNDCLPRKPEIEQPFVPSSPSHNSNIQFSLSSFIIHHHHHHKSNGFKTWMKAIIWGQWRDWRLRFWVLEMEVKNGEFESSIFFGSWIQFTSHSFSFQIEVSVHNWRNLNFGFVYLIENQKFNLEFSNSRLPSFYPAAMVNQIGMLWLVNYS